MTENRSHTIGRTTQQRPCYGRLALNGRLLQQARPYWPQLAGILALSLLAPSIKLLSPIPLKIAVDSVLGDRPLPGPLASIDPAGSLSNMAMLLLAAGMMVGIALLGQSVGMISSLLSTYVGEKLVRSFRAILFGHAQRLSLSYHDSKGTSDSSYRIQYNAPCIRWIVVDGGIPLVCSAFTLVAMLAVVTILDWQLAVVALGIAPVLYLLSHVYGGRLRRQSKELKQLESSALSVIYEVLSAIRVVKAFGQEEREQERFVARSDQGLCAKLRVALATNFLGVLVGLTVAIGTASVLVIGVMHVQQEVLTLGELLMVMAYLSQLYGPMETMSKKVADLQASLVSAERAFSLLDQSPDVFQRPDARPLSRVEGAFQLDAVCFAYPENPLVLHSISCRVPAGSRVGIQGHTGAGKTTLVNLIARFFDPTSGQILLDGEDMRDFKLDDLRRQFAIVLQEPVLFSTSIGENIAYARPDASKEELIAAARAANAHDFIQSLPDAYETRVGERGMRLSGGERQRISLARAFLKDAPILILDEPTSSVDTETESLIMDAMERLMEGRTTFIIAHRLGTLEGCDLRLKLEQGRLVETTPGPAADMPQTMTQ